MKIPRYSLTLDADSDGTTLNENGEWCKWADVLALLAQLGAARNVQAHYEAQFRAYQAKKEQDG